MGDAGAGEPREAVLAAGRAVDPRFTAVVLKKWRDAGLVPRPVARPGRGRGHGRGAVYPPGTTAQLLRLLAIRAEGGRFDPDRALWRLWWEGWPIASASVRALLADELAAHEAVLAEAFAGDELGEATLSQLVRMATGPLSGPLRLVRAVVGADGLVLVSAVMLRVAAGRFGAWDDAEEGRIVERAVGIDRARHDRIGAVPPWFRGRLDEVLRMLSGAVAPPVLRGALAEAGKDDFDRARDELRMMVALAGAVGTMLAGLGRPGAFGLAHLSAAAELDHGYLPKAVLAWLSLRRLPEVQEGIAVLGHLTPLVDMVRATAAADPR